MIQIKKKEEKEGLTTAEAASILGIDYFHARKELLKSKVPHHKYGAKRVWSRADILAFKEQHHIYPVGE